jgi:hypothetical protein
VACADVGVVAQRFYTARRGVAVDDEWSDGPGGGRIHGLRYVWRDPMVLR